MDIDRKLLTAAEAEEYDQLVKVKSNLPQVYSTTGWRLPARVWGVIVAWFLTWAGTLSLIAWWAFATSVRGVSGGYKFEMPILLLGFAVLVAGVVFPIVWQSRDRKRIAARIDAAQGDIDGLLKRVGYESRVKRAQCSGDTPSLRQSQHAWYGSHSELNWRHREQGQALGFDNADDYVNNFLESE